MVIEIKMKNTSIGQIIDQMQTKKRFNPESPSSNSLSLSVFRTQVLCGDLHSTHMVKVEF